MEIYNCFDEHHDLLIAQWYQFLVDSEDMDTMFANRHTLGSLLVAMRPPTVCLFEHDDKGVWAVFWYEPIFNGAFFSVWMRKDKRATVNAVTAMRKAIKAGLEAWPTLIGVTKQKRLLPIHLKLGYNLVGMIPKLFGGHDAYILTLTRKET